MFLLGPNLECDFGVPVSYYGNVVEIFNDDYCFSIQIHLDSSSDYSSMMIKLFNNHPAKICLALSESFSPKRRGRPLGCEEPACEELFVGLHQLLSHSASGKNQKLDINL